MNRPLCACGCGEPVTLHRDTKKPNTYRYGHHSRVTARKSWEDYPEPVRDLETGCLRWQGPKHTAGYGKVGSKGYAHRIAYERHHGPIPAGQVIDHVHARGCRYRDCVNVDHLEVVSGAENVRRGAPSRRTTCPEGHPYEGHNLNIRRGRRECRTCVYDRNKRDRERRRLASPSKPQQTPSNPDTKEPTP